MRDAVVIEHRIEAPIDVVFSYFVDPDRYRLWQGKEARLDPRPGGVYEVDYVEAGRVRGEYILIDPPNHVVFTWGWEHDDRLPESLRAVAPGTSTVEVTLSQDGAATIVRLRHTGLVVDESREAHGKYWPLYIQRLEAAIVSRDRGVDPGIAALTD